MSAVPLSSVSNLAALVGQPLPAAAGHRAVTLAALLARGDAVVEAPQSLRRLQRQLLLPLAVAAGLVVAWCAFAPLSGAVVATGQVQASLGRSVVQHQEGGIVRSLLVRPGQAVRRGDPLLVVGDVRSDAALDMLRKQLDAEQLRSLRCRAELALAPRFEVPAALAQSLSADALQRERQLFDTRRQTLNDQVAALQSQAREAQLRSAALKAQLAATEQATRLARDELGVNAELVASGFMQKSRLFALERNVADARMRAEAARGQIAEAQMQVASLANAIAQARGAYQQRAADDLKDAGVRVRELEDRLRPSQDQVDRQTVRAPVDGTVMAVRVAAAGTAVGPREPLLEIAPSGDRLVVETRIDPHDIEHVRTGGAAEVRLSAFNARATPLLPAVVTEVAPDAVSERPGEPAHFKAQVSVDASALAEHPELRLQAGMPAEVYVTTPPRSFLRYLLEPLGLFARRAMREP